MNSVIVIGAGPAGLTAAYELNKRFSGELQIFESEDQVGGISKTVHKNGWRFDLGGHRFFSKSNYVNSLWVAVGSGSNSIAYSSNGTQWTGLGTTIILSKPMLMGLLDKKDKINYNIIDDLELGYVIEKEFPSLPFYSLENYFVYVDEKTNIEELNYANIIFYRNKSDQRKHDIQNMKKIVYRLS